MISTNIVNEIAHLIQKRDLTLKNPKDIKEIKVQTGLSLPSDALELSQTAVTYAHIDSRTSELEKEQAMKVERLKALVNSGNYKMDQGVVNEIAERITNMLV
jgi:anti-sigma28 factor (negative regulator of flagellin synthesis)